MDAERSIVTDLVGQMDPDGKFVLSITRSYSYIYIGVQVEHLTLNEVNRTPFAMMST